MDSNHRRERERLLRGNYITATEKDELRKRATEIDFTSQKRRSTERVFGFVLGVISTVFVLWVMTY